MKNYWVYVLMFQNIFFCGLLDGIDFREGIV